MPNYEVGYGRPPVQTRFRKGTCPNPKGRGAKKGLEVGKIFGDVVHSHMEISEGGRRKRITKTEYIIRSLVMAAVNGDVKAATQLLKIHRYSEQHGDYTSQVVVIDPAEEASEAYFALVQDRPRYSRSKTEF